MTANYSDAVSAKIEAAFAAMQARRIPDGLAAFREARRMAAETCDQAALQAILDREQAALVTEAKAMKGALDAANPPQAQRRVLIFSDSLALPRPDRPDEASSGYAGAYPFMLQKSLAARARESGEEPIAVSAWCQRYLTTDGVVDLLPRLRANAAGADIVVHVGLNDCANRIFLVRERHAVSLLPAPVGARLVEFGRVYRRSIISSQANYAYVPLDRFAANLARLAGFAREFGARRMIFATIVMPPLRAHPATPNMAQNFTRYNLLVYENAQKHRAGVLDTDRLMWENGNAVTLLPDGMHLAEPGHRVMAQGIEALVTAGAARARPAPAPDAIAASPG